MRRYLGVEDSALKRCLLRAGRPGIVESGDGFSVENGAAATLLFCKSREDRVSADHHLPFSGLSTQLEHANASSSGESLEKGPDSATPRFSGGRLWMHRIAVLLFVFFCAILGVILIIFPWRDEWTTNSLLIGYPGLQDFMASGFVRGLVSGLGVLDIWIGFWEAIHYRE
jgi:hypothetical protein